MIVIGKKCKIFYGNKLLGIGSVEFETKTCHDDLPHLWKVGDIVTRDGTDEQEIIEISHDWNMLTVKCIKEPEHSRWCKLDEIEQNLIRRYSFVRTGVLNAESIIPKEKSH